MSVTEGVFEAKNDAKFWIAPGFVEGNKILEPQLIQFEVGVTVSKEGNGHITVFSIAEAGGKAKSEHVNRISFSVPVYFQSPKHSEDFSQ